LFPLSRILGTLGNLHPDLIYVFVVARIRQFFGILKSGKKKTELKIEVGTGGV